MEIELDMQLHAFFQLPKAMETLNAQTELAGKTLIPIKKGSVLPGSCKKTSERLHFKSKPCMKEIKGIIPSPVQWSILYATRQQWNSRRRCARQTHTLVRNIAATMTLTMKSCNCKQSKKAAAAKSGCIVVVIVQAAPPTTMTTSGSSPTAHSHKSTARKLWHSHICLYFTYKYSLIFSDSQTAIFVARRKIVSILQIKYTRKAVRQPIFTV